MRIRSSQKLLSFFCLALLLVAPFPGRFVCAASPPEMATDLNNVELRVFVKYISEITGKKIIIDPDVKGRVNILSPKSIARGEAMTVLDSVLEVLDFTTIESGPTIKIVPKANARSKDVPLFSGLLPTRPADHVITRMIRLKFADSEAIKRILIPMMPKTGVIMSHQPTNTLILTDTGRNISRLEKIVSEIDIPGREREMSLVPLQHAAAATTAASLNRLFDTPQAKPTALLHNESPKFIADERTNSLLVLASKAELPRILATIKALDKKSHSDAGNIHVVYLKYANAEALAAVLTELPQKEEKDLKTKGRPSGLSDDIKVVADKATNSLVITADKNDFLVMREVIDKLDIPRRMVYLEAAIMEVSFAKNFKLGVEWRAGGTTGGEVIAGGFGGSRDAPFANLNALPVLPGGLAVGVIGQGITVGNVVFPNLGAMIEAYKSDSDVNILSTPQILTTDNQEAEIKVGENVPYIVRQETSQTDRDYSSYEYRDVGVTLKITPQISQDGLVRLDVFQETVKLKNPDAVSDKPITLKRSAKTTVMVQDRKTVVIGGIIGEDKSSGAFKVPVLGDIPILGRLFTTETESTEKTNLYIFITPHIIDNPTQAAAMAGDKKHTMAQLAKDGIAAGVKAVFSSQDMILADLGYLAIHDGNILEAEQYYNASLAINPANPYALFNQALLLERKGEKDAARLVYQKVSGMTETARAHATHDRQAMGKSIAALARRRLQQLVSSAPVSTP